MTIAQVLLTARCRTAASVALRETEFLSRHGDERIQPQRLRISCRRVKPLVVLTLSFLHFLSLRSQLKPCAVHGMTYLERKLGHEGLAGRFWVLGSGIAMNATHYRPNLEPARSVAFITAFLSQPSLDTSMKNNPLPSTIGPHSNGIY